MPGLWFRRAALPAAVFSLVLTAVTARAEDVRVRLQRIKSTISISGVSMRYTGAVEPAMGVPYQALKLSWTAGRGAGGMNVWTIEDRDSGKKQTVRARTFEISGQNLRVNLRPVPDRLSLQPATRAEADLIADMDLEQYVRGVLPAEMPKNWPMEALKAQAVAARTFALFRRRSRDRIKAPYHLEADVMDQVFMMPLHSSDSGAARIDSAVRETAGLVLRDKKSRLFAAYFHADCGGQTEDARHVWGDAANLGTAVDEACPLSPHAKWTADLTATAIARKIHRPPGAEPVGKEVALESIAISGQTKSGRADEIFLIWSDGVERRISAHDFRMAVGHDIIRSTRFQVSKTTDGRFWFSGRGYGHGVGLCQWGARHLALHGSDFHQILAHYYPKAKLGPETL